MPRRTPDSFEDRVLTAIEANTDDMLNRLVAQAGPPADADKLSEADLDEAWETADPSVDYETMAQQILTQGLPPEIARGLLVLKIRPEWAPLYGRPTQSAELAHQLARLAQYPFRLSVLEDIDDPDEQVAAAERLDRRFQKRATARQVQAAEVPSEPASRGMQTRPGAAYGGMEGT